MMTLKKKITIAMLSACTFVFGAFGVSVANADTQNWLAVRYGEKQKTAFLGEEATLAEVMPVYPDKVDRIVFSVESPDGNTVAHDGNTFEITQTGEYSVFVCVVGKDGKTYAETYKVSASTSEKPIVKQAPTMPVAFLEGSAYDAPEAVFVDYNTAKPETVEYEVFVIDEDGNQTQVTDRLEPTVTLHGTEITLKYVAKSSVTNEEQVLEYDVPVLKAFTLDEDLYREYSYDKMFVTESVETSATTEIGATFYGKSDFTATYANKLYGDWSIVLKSMEGKVNFASVVVTVSDFKDKNCYHTFEFSAIDDETSNLVVNGSSRFTVAGSILNFGSGLGLYYGGAFKTISDSNGSSITGLTTTALGAKFDGFKSGFVTIKVEAKGVSSDSVLAVTNINVQSFTRANRYDMFSPYIIPSVELVVKNNLNARVYVPKALAYDVVDPDVYAGITIYAPNGDVVTAIDGTLLYEATANTDYYFIADQVGEYTLQYFASDVNENTYDFGYYTVYVVDTIAPTLTLNSYLKTSVSVGETVVIPKLTYSDNLTATAELKVLITVTLPNGLSYKTVKSGDSFKFETKGTYYVRYTVVDSFYNMTTITQVIECK